MNRKELFKSFKECFPEYNEEHDFKVGEDGSWIFAVANKEAVALDKNREGFHYELIARGNDEFYVELHFELYKYQWPDMRDALIKVLNQEDYRREIIATSYYSSLIWRVRRPVFNGGDISKALCWLRKAVGEAKIAANDPQMESVKSDVATKSAPLMLNGPCSIAAIAQMLIEGSKDENTQDKSCNRLVIPSVQRGKVWNAARIETLWDSIFRNIPIGALSIRNRRNDPTAFDLLDGQQRATAIALGYDHFPDDYSRKFESILWIDLNKNKGDRDENDKEIRYDFFVTTASQPWGYADSNNETKNNLLPEWEKREAAKTVPDAQWEEDQIKPYPFQLFPVRAKLPVPYTLLREYAEKAVDNGGVKFKTFLEFLGNKNLNKCLLCKLWSVGYRHDCNQFSVGDDATINDSEFEALCEKVVAISKDYKVFLLDASSVAENDIALYFTRIGKGGVVPSDEELAYSVLKSKLSPDFRETIQSIHNDYGLASESRIAHIAIRLFKSESNEEKTSKPQFYSGPVFSAVMDMCKEENAYQKRAFAEFITGKLKERIELVKGKYQLTQWHSARYASERNGDVFLLLLLAAGRDDLFAGYDVKGLAELLFGYASHVDYSVRKIFEEGVPIALANLTKETYYGKPRLTLPVPPEKFDDIKQLDSPESLQKWKDSHPEAAQTIAEGYNNSSYDHALNILLYACRDSKLNNKFQYNKELGLWAEDNCPWDYDHIMPHSTIEKMEVSNDKAVCDKAVCEWLKNSIGNLAPLPFSLNRSLSDAARDADYPCGKEQSALWIDGIAIKSMWENGQISPWDFCKMVIARFKKLYAKWYYDIGLKEMVNFKAALEAESPAQDVWRVAKRRFLVFSQVADSLAGWTFKRIVADKKESEIPEHERCKEFCCNQVITLSLDVKKSGLAVALSKCGIHGAWEIGLRKLSTDSSTDNHIFGRVKALDDNIDKSKIQNENELWWYWYDEIKDSEDVNVQEIVEGLKSLLQTAEKMS